MLIYQILRNDHLKIMQLINELLTLEEGDDTRKDLIEQMRDELVPHARAEESVFYNSLRSINAAKDLVKESYKEHMEAESLLRALQLKDKVDMDWKATAQKLRQALAHHIQEEESEVFSVAKMHLTNDEAEMMGEAFERLKPEIREEGLLKTSIDLIANMMPPRFSSIIRNQGLDRYQ